VAAAPARLFAHRAGNGRCLARGAGRVLRAGIHWARNSAEASLDQFVRPAQSTGRERGETDAARRTASIIEFGWQT